MLVCKNSNKITDYFNTKFSNLSDYKIYRIKFYMNINMYFLNFI